MKIQCDLCEKSPATVICCADEAALCAKCDVEVHQANKLASKHQRLPLDSLSNKLPKCDICQEKTAFIFCVEDRALFCRDCDEAKAALCAKFDSLHVYEERKERVGERIVALQQLVSPFGKTDTASVLIEAIGYIKFLHDQVKFLSAPYLQSIIQESEHYSLRSRGLCLFPICGAKAVLSELDR